MNRNFLDMLAALSAESAEFLVVGAFAVIYHGLTRSTGDLDIWIRRSPENAQRVWKAIHRFRAPLHGLELKDLEEEDIVYYVGIAPQRIDILTSISGVEFDEAWPHRHYLEIENVRFPVLGKAELIKNKRASGRPKDLADLAWLESETNKEKD
jgi:hypothetical protein